MGNEQDNVNSNTERIVRLETLVESQTSFLTRIESKIDALSEKYITKDMFNEITSSLQKQVTELRSEKKENRRMLPDIIMAISAFISLGLTFYLMFHK